jgi:transposase
MKKNTTRADTAKQNVIESPKKKLSIKELRKRAAAERLTIGLDLGDRHTHYCVIDAQGEVLVEDKLPTSKAGLDGLLQGLAACRVAMEVGTHSGWVSRHIGQQGHEVIVANARRIAWITQSRRKNDRIDARKLAQLARVDLALLAPIRHRSEQAQQELAVIRARAALVEARTSLINAARGQAKTLGERLAGCDADQVGAEMAAGLPGEVRTAVEGLLRMAAQLTVEIRNYDRQIHTIAGRYPELELLTAIYGVGELTALAFVLTIEDQQRFKKSREVGAFLGLVPGQDQSGARDLALRITKEGDRLLRTLLVQCAHCIVRAGAPDSDVRRWALGKLEQDQREAERNGQAKNPRKKRVLVAVARRLAVLMHHLWATGEVYDPLYQAKAEARVRKVAA